MAHPATKKRGGNPDVKQKSENQKSKDAMERKLEQGWVDGTTFRWTREEALAA